nr:hypothetical protein Iba_chr10cCG9630 [Ipomoea batatas]
MEPLATGRNKNAKHISPINPKRRPEAGKNNYHFSFNVTSNSAKILLFCIVYITTAQIVNTAKSTIPIISAAVTTPNGPSTRTGNVHRRKLAPFPAFFLCTSSSPERMRCGMARNAMIRIGALYHKNMLPVIPKTVPLVAFVRVLDKLFINSAGRRKIKAAQRMKITHITTFRANFADETHRGVFFFPLNSSLSFRRGS